MASKPLSLQQWNALPSSEKSGERGTVNFARLSNKDKTTVVNNNISRQIVQPLINRMISRSKEADQNRLAAMKGETK